MHTSRRHFGCRIVSSNCRVDNSETRFQSNKLIICPVIPIFVRAISSVWHSYLTDKKKEANLERNSIRIQWVISIQIDSDNPSKPSVCHWVSCVAITAPTKTMAIVVTLDPSSCLTMAAQKHGLS